MSNVRSKRQNEFETIAERLAERRGGVMLHKPPPIRRICFWDAERRRLLLGHDTRHRTWQARLWRCRLRIKRPVR